MYIYSPHTCILALVCIVCIVYTNTHVYIYIHIVHITIFILGIGELHDLSRKNPGPRPPPLDEGDQALLPGRQGRYMNRFSSVGKQDETGHVTQVLIKPPSHENHDIYLLISDIT